MSDGETEIEDQPTTMPLQVDHALKMIPEFSGDRENLHKFLVCCDIVNVQATSKTDKETFLNIVKTKLCGSAYNLIKYKTFTTWPELKLLLQGQYLEKRTIAQIQTELLNSRQLPGESVRSYSNRLERLTLDLTDACISSQGIAATAVIEDLNAKAVLAAFVEGLQSPYKLIIKASRFSKFEDAVEAACEEERVVNASKPQKSNHNNHPNRPKCFNCGKQNHIAKDCYSNPLPRYHPKTEIKRESNVNSVSKVCRYCKNVGHTIDQCRKRQFNNSRFQHNNHNPGPSRNSNFNSNNNNYRQDSQNSGNGSRPAATGSASQVRELRSV